MPADETYAEERPARRSLRRLLAKAVAVDGVDFMVGSIIIMMVQSHSFRGKEDARGVSVVCSVFFIHDRGSYDTIHCETFELLLAFCRGTERLGKRYRETGKV